MLLHEVLPKFYNGYPIRRKAWVKTFYLIHNIDNEDMCSECGSIVSIEDMLANDWEFPDDSA